MFKCDQRKVSIIIPIYNAEKIIERCISHICNQTYSNIEIICVNDGSKDRSCDILNKLANVDSRVIVVDKPNGGVSSARNAGLNVATGEYVQFVDSDDLIESNMVEIMVGALEKNDVELVVCGYKFSNGQPERMPVNGIWDKKEFLNNLLEFYVGGFICSPWNKLFIRDHIKNRFNEEMAIGEDALFNMEYIAKTTRICTIENTPYLYTVDNVDSLSWKYNDNAFYCEEQKNKYILECLKEENLQKEQSLFKNEFKKDFVRCLNNEIFKSNYTAKEICERAYNCITNPFWYDVLIGDKNLDLSLERNIKNEIKKYVYCKLPRKYLINIKKIVKSIVKR